jgi:hypothetical protein
MDITEANIYVGAAVFLASLGASSLPSVRMLRAFLWPESPVSLVRWHGIPSLTFHGAAHRRCHLRALDIPSPAFQVQSALSNHPSMQRAPPSCGSDIWTR